MARELTMNDFSFGLISIRCFLGGSESSEMNLLSLLSDRRRVGRCIAEIALHPAKSALWVTKAVCLVLSFRGLSQVLKPIVVSFSAAMIDFIGRPFSLMERPCDPVRHVMLTIDLDVDVSISALASRDIARLSATFLDAPRNQASDGIIGKLASKVCDINGFHCPIITGLSQEGIA